MTKREASTKLRLSKAKRAELVADFKREVTALKIPWTKDVRAARKKLSAKLRDVDGQDVIAIGRDMIAANARIMGYEVIHHHRDAMTMLDVKTLEKLGNGISAWEHVDTFGIYLSGHAWLTGQIKDADVKRWAKSDDLWWRRTALVSTVVLNSRTRGGGYTGGDAKRTLAIASMLIDDREDMVVKAMSWAVRALAAVDPASARAFLEANDARLAARVKREARTKLETGRKNKPRGRG
jgi:3-methyladenine DNA glycosylase AlkD